MARTERVTVTMPDAVVKEIDRLARNRSKFVLEAVQREIQLRRREALRRSLESPHPESKLLAEAGFDEWARNLPDESVEELLDPAAGTPVQWIQGEGWSETES